MRKKLSTLAALVLVFLLFFACISGVSAASTTNVYVKNKAGKVLATFPVVKTAASDGLQDALDYVRDHASAKNILVIALTAGTYVVDDPLNIYSHTTLDLTRGIRLKRSGESTLLMFGLGADVTTGYTGYQNISILGSKDKYAVLDGNGGTTTIFRFAHANNIKFQYLEFTNVTDAHHVELAASNKVTFDSCKFTGYKATVKDDGTNKEALQLDILHKEHFSGYNKYDGTMNQNITITNNVFVGLNRGVGTHSGQIGKYMKNITISNNTFKNINGYAIGCTNYAGATITNNTIVDCGAGISVRHISPEYENYYPGNNKTIQTDLNTLISGNSISLKKTTYPSTAFGISVYGKLVTKKTKTADAVIPAADFRVSNVTITKNKISSTGYANGIWLCGTMKSTVSNNSIVYKIAKKTSEHCDGIKLEDSTGITIYKNSLTDNGKTPLAKTGIYLYNTTSSKIQSCTVKNFQQNGIHLKNADKCTVTKNTVSGVKENGIYIDAGSGTAKKRIPVTSNAISKVGGRGIFINDKSYADIQSNTITSPGGEGIYLATKADADVISNTISSAGSHGIYVRNKACAGKIQKNKITAPKENGICFNKNATGTTVSSNTVKNAGNYGITVQSSKVTKITSNTVQKAKRGLVVTGGTVTTLENNTLSTSKEDGLYIAEKSTVKNILKNKITSSGSNGIHVSGTSKCTTVESNTITTSGLNGIYIKDKGQITTLSNNKITTVKSNGICVATKAKLTTASKNTITDSALRGICVIEGSVGTISGNTITKSKNKYSATDGIYIANATAKVSSVTSNKVLDVSGNGIYLNSGTTASKVEKNTVTNTALNGIFINEKSKVTTLSKNTVTSSKAVGIYVANGSAVNTISGNTVTKVTKCGIALYSTKAGSSVTSNTIKTSAKYGLDIAGDGAAVTVSGNSITACQDAEIRIQSTVSKKLSASEFTISSIRASASAVVVTWDSLKNADGYIVCRSTSQNGTYKALGKTSDLSYTDASAAKGKTYYYKVIPCITYAKVSVECAPSAAKKLTFK